MFKKVWLLVLLAVLPTTAICGELEFTIDTQQGILYQVDTHLTISYDKGNKYITVLAKNGTEFRIYDCGKVTKKTWKEINPNEDTTLTVSTAADLVIDSNGWVIQGN